MSTYQYYAPQCTLFGYGCLESLGKELKDRGYSSALLVTDHSLTELGMVKSVTDMLEANGIGYTLYDKVKSNPDLASVNEGVEIQKKSKNDFVISLGGGSAHDCAKAIALLATNGGSVLDYRGADKTKSPSLPLVAINTTAGTASECTRAYVIVNESTNEKFGNKDKHALATIAVDDHRLMMNLPKGLTAGTGMDALTHAIEAYTSVNGFLMTSSLALAAIRLIFKNLREAVEEQTEKSREGMAVGQYLAGLAFGNAGCGLVHSMSHPLSGLYDLPHGLCNAILLPYVCRFNGKEAAACVRYAEIAREIFPMECNGLSDQMAADLLFVEIETLSEHIGTKQLLGALGVKKEDILLLSQNAMKDGSLPNNPVQPDVAEIQKIYMEAM